MIGSRERGKAGSGARRARGYTDARTRTYATTTTRAKEDRAGTLRVLLHERGRKKRKRGRRTVPRGTGCVRATNTRNGPGVTERCGAERKTPRRRFQFPSRLRLWYAKPGWVPASVVMPTRSLVYESILRIAGVSPGEARDVL